MAEFNFFELIPEAALADPLSIKSEIKDENELNDSDKIDPLAITTTSDVNEGERKAKQRRTIDLATFSTDTSSSSSSSSRTTPNIENSNKSADYTDYYTRYQNGNSNLDTKSELEILLTKGGDGKIIKRSYKTNGGFLPDTVRTILVHLIVKHEMDKALSTLSENGQEKLEEFTITSNQMQNYANDIVKIFPSEKAETYFGGFKTVNGMRILAHGKLWDHYNYIKSVLRDQGVLEGRKFKKKKQEKPTVVDEETRKKLDWLLTNPAPWPEILKNWKDTFEARTEGHSELEKKQLSQYYQTYACLRDQQAVALIQSDFDQLYKKKPFNFTESWNILKPHLISKLQICKAIKTLDDKAYIHLVPTLTPEQQDGVILFLLPSLVPCGRQKRRNDDQEETRKLTASERRETFIIYASSEAEVDSILEKKREDLKRSGRILHPTPVGVGSVMGITAAYVAVDDVKYKVSSLLNAIDLSYKIYYAAHCDFPESCHSLWLFIQKALFDIHYPTDRATPSLHALVGEARRVIDSKTKSS